MQRRRTAPILVCADHERNAEVLAAVLHSANLPHISCATPGDLDRELRDLGGRVAAVIVTDRALALGAREALVRFQENEPEWSELPIVVLAPADDAVGRGAGLRNVIHVGRPATSQQILDALQPALDLRGYQFEVHDLNARLEQQRHVTMLALERRRAAAADDHRERRERRLLERQLARAERRLSRTREESRLALARELHDQPVQRLQYLGFRLAAASTAVRGGEPEEAVAIVDEARRETQETVKELRRFIRELRPSGIDSDLAEALEPNRARLEPTTEVLIDADLPEDADEEVRTAVYRVAQEALRNVERHAHARRARVSLRQRREGLVLLVADDGQGFDASRDPRDMAHDEHFGLLGIVEQIEGLGGMVTFRSAPGKGTCIKAVIPVGG